MGMPNSGEIIIAFLIVLLLISALCMPIAKKAGYSKWWALIMIVPIVNIVVFWIFAFAKWPNER